MSQVEIDADWEALPMRRALAERDIGTVYRLLCGAGVSQRRISDCVGQSRSEVCEIIRGRAVRNYDVLWRTTR